MLLRFVLALCQGKLELAAENLALRQQLAILQRTARRPKLRQRGRFRQKLLPNAPQVLRRQRLTIRISVTDLRSRENRCYGLSYQRLTAWSVTVPGLSTTPGTSGNRPAG